MKIECPVHKTEMCYSPYWDLYACQFPQCKYAHGVSSGSAFRSDMFKAQRKGPKVKRDKWDGRDALVHNQIGHKSGKDIEMRMSLTGASQLALAIKRMQQTYHSVPREVQELVDALDFVLVGDPGAVARHKVMEAGKGMEPAGADPKSYLPGHQFMGGSIDPERCVVRPVGRNSNVCGHTRVEHETAGRQDDTVVIRSSGLLDVPRDGDL